MGAGGGDDDAVARPGPGERGVLGEQVAARQASAEALRVHVNTLRRRLARIEELTGRSLHSMEARVGFFLALRTLETSR
jgi:sugar diacid utilization regulator